MKKILVIIPIILIILTLSACNSKEEMYLVLLEGQDTVEINSTWEDAGAKFYVGNTEFQAVTDDFVDTSRLGLQEIKYHNNYDGKKYEITRYVMVVDQMAPVITLNLGVDTLKQGETWVDAGATVVDNSLEELTIVVTGTVDTSTVGTYEITYTATDSSGNTSSIIRYVDVLK
jgi:hypothetical protein